MAIKITSDCINCGACELECPNHAIYEGNKKWSFSDGTKLNGKILINSNKYINANFLNSPKKKNKYFIVSEKCTECVGFYDEPQCAAVCPVNCCIQNENIIESKKDLLKKKKFLHG